MVAPADNEDIDVVTVMNTVENAMAEGATSEVLQVPDIDFQQQTSSGDNAVKYENHLRLAREVESSLPGQIENLQTAMRSSIADWKMDTTKVSRDMRRNIGETLPHEQLLAMQDKINSFMKSWGGQTKLHDAIVNLIPRVATVAADHGVAQSLKSSCESTKKVPTLLKTGKTVMKKMGIKDPGDGASIQSYSNKYQVNKVLEALNESRLRRQKSMSFDDPEDAKWEYLAAASGSVSYSHSWSPELGVGLSASIGCSAFQRVVYAEYTDAKNFLVSNPVYLSVDFGVTYKITDGPSVSVALSPISSTTDSLAFFEQLMKMDLANLSPEKWLNSMMATITISNLWNSGNKANSAANISTNGLKESDSWGFMLPRIAGRAKTINWGGYSGSVQLNFGWSNSGGSWKATDPAIKLRFGGGYSQYGWGNSFGTQIAYSRWAHDSTKSTLTGFPWFLEGLGVSFFANMMTENKNTNTLNPNLDQSDVAADLDGQLDTVRRKLNKLKEEEEDKADEAAEEEELDRRLASAAADAEANAAGDLAPVEEQAVAPAKDEAAAPIGDAVADAPISADVPMEEPKVEEDGNYQSQYASWEERDFIQ